MREVIMGYQGEMSLKGLNRNQFESAMMKILRYRLKTVGKFRVYCTQSTFYMEPEEEDIDMDLAFDRVKTVFGLAALSRAVVCEKDFDTICQPVLDAVEAMFSAPATARLLPLDEFTEQLGEVFPDVCIRHGADKVTVGHFCGSSISSISRSLARVSTSICRRAFFCAAGMAAFSAGEIALNTAPAYPGILAVRSASEISSCKSVRSWTSF